MFINGAGLGGRLPVFHEKNALRVGCLGKKHYLCGLKSRPWRSSRRGQIEWSRYKYTERDKGTTMVTDKVAYWTDIADYDLKTAEAMKQN